MKKLYRHLPIGMFCFLLVVCLNGCAHMDASSDPRDPYEGFNRSVYHFNEVMDDKIFNPIGRAYKAVLPNLIDRGISNAFSNIADVAVIVNDILQLKIGQSVADIGRLVFNSTIGLLGFFDVSTRLDLPKHHEDFGQTLARWGFSAGPYLVIPLFGPATVRDAVGYGLDNSVLTPITYINDAAYQAGVLTLKYIDFKAGLLSANKLINEAALDKYEFTKNAYFNLRENLIHDRDGSLEEIDETVLTP